MTQQELDTIVESHQHWLKEDCEGWEGMRADLRGVNLYGADLKVEIMEAKLWHKN